MATTQDEGFILKAIEQAVREETARIAAEEIEAAQQRIAERVKAHVDAIALKTMSHYEAYTDARRIHIIVKKEI